MPLGIEQECRKKSVATIGVLDSSSPIADEFCITAISGAPDVETAVIQGVRKCAAREPYSDSVNGNVHIWRLRLSGEFEGAWHYLKSC